MVATQTVVRPITLNGTGTVNPLGTAAITFNGSQNSQTGLAQGAFTFFLNRVDGFNLTTTPQPLSKMTNVSSTGQIAGGTGAYSGATGSITYTFKFVANASSSGTFTLTGSGNITVGQTTTAITLIGFSGTASVASAASGTLQASSTGNVAPFGNVTVNFSGIAGQKGASGSPPGPSQGELTLVFNANDSFIASFSAVLVFSTTTPTSLPCVITGGTGMFSGATGSLAASFALSPGGSTFTLTGSGTITQPAAGTPIITSLSTAYGSTSIAQNTWLEIYGTNLVPSDTPAGGASWSNAPELAQGRLPTQLDGVSATVNGKPAFIWFFCSAATSAVCTSDQINLLTPLDNTVGLVEVVVTNGAVSSAPFTVDMQAISPSFILFDAPGHVAAEHADFSLLAPASLFPGHSTPAQRGETILLYAVGFGLPANPPVNGSAVQSGPIVPNPACIIGTLPATVAGANLISPGLYQLNVVVPAGAPSGDNLIACAYAGSNTPPGALIAVK
jgi:uncharacterized protein (TIGR03437 family)